MQPCTRLHHLKTCRREKKEKLEWKSRKNQWKQRRQNSTVSEVRKLKN